MTRSLADTLREADHPLVMGVLNITPDSFSDGGAWLDRDAAIGQARRMVDEGAAIIDVGGESTRPGADAVSEAEEIRRVVPVIRALVADVDAIVSVDTSKAAVMEAAVEAGAGLINDVRGLTQPGALETAAATGADVCLMHMQGEPRTMQRSPAYGDVVADILAWLDQRVAACEAAGIARDRLVLDPGFGFGKTLDHNLALLAHLDRFAEAGLPVLAGLSRKSMLEALTGRPVDQRLAGSLALATLAVWRGASIIRAHDVAPTVDAVRVAAAARTARDNGSFSNG